MWPERVVAYTEDRVLFEPGTELQSWAKSFEVHDSADDYAFGPESVYVSASGICSRTRRWMR